MSRGTIKQAVATSQLQFVSRNTVARVVNQFRARVGIVVPGGEYKPDGRSDSTSIPGNVGRIIRVRKSLFAQADRLAGSVGNVTQPDMGVLVEDTRNWVSRRIVR